MKTTSTFRVKNLIAFFALTLLFTSFTENVFGQTPTIVSVSPSTGLPLSTVVITGAGFDATLTGNDVYFGNVKASVTLASATSLTVTVPLGAQYAPISVVNRTTRLTAISSAMYAPDYDNSCFIPNTNTFKPRVDFTIDPSDVPNSDPYHTAIGDIDGDGKPDLIACIYDTFAGGQTYLYIYRNIGVQGQLAYAAPYICTTASGGYNVKLADLDRDGKLDIIIAAGGQGRIGCNRNMSTPGTISIAPVYKIALKRGSVDVVVADFDGDGKLDLAASIHDSNYVEIFRNNITTIPANAFITNSFISYSTKLPTGAYPYDICAGDIDGDGKPDIITSNIIDGTISVLRNISLVDTCIFEAKRDYAVGITPSGLRLVDINGDNKPEILVCNNGGENFSILQNNITATPLVASSFGAAVDITTGAGTTPGAVAGGDFDGDGKVDLAITSGGSDVVLIFNNTYTGGVGGTLTAGAFTLGNTFSTGTGSAPSGISIGDMDGDNKPDIVTGNIGNNTISIFKNTSTPDTVSIRGIDTLCLTTSQTLANNHCPNQQAYWSVTNGNATILGGTGVLDTNAVLTGVAAGYDTVVCTIVSLYDTNYVKYVVNILPLADTGNITGLSAVCVNAAITLANTAPGGTWTSTVPAVATVDAVTGVVTGVSPGTTTILFTVTSASCGPLSASHVVTVNAIPTAGIITGANGVCTGSSITLTASAPGGTWVNTHPTVAADLPSGTTDVLTGLLVGADTILYVVNTPFCGSDTARHNVGVITTGISLPIGGPDSVCSGATITLTNGATGGTWVSSNTAIASVDAVTGVVTGGTTTGTATITYTVAYGCGPVVAYHDVTTNPLPNAGTITGADSVCSLASITLTETSTSGVWSSASSAIATVSPTGVVTGVSATLATTTITYTSATFSCGTLSTDHLVTVKVAPNAGAITGADSVCSAASINLANATGDPSGVWGTTNASIATVTPAGVVTGVSTALATTTITYTSTTFSCGTLTANHPVTVNPLPNAGTITGADSVCSLSSITLTETSASGVWSSLSSTVATVSPTGVVTGVSAALATTTITYTSATFRCGTLSTDHPVTVKALPNAGTITGADSVCSLATINLTNATATPGGVWGSTGAAIATVTSGGVVTGLSSTLATTTITYTSSTFSCGTATANHPVTVNPLPAVSPITGLDSVCSGAIITLADATAGGTWSTLSSAIATVNTGGGVGGASATLATTTISYTSATFSCGSAVATHAVTVKALPNAGAITGADSVCSGATINLANPTGDPAGIWGSLAPAIATVSATGVVTGLATTLSTATIFFTSNTFSCGSATVAHPVTVKPLPFAGTITGLDSVCSGATIALADATPGGVWTSLSSAIATVTTGGVVGGASAALATTTISYTVSTFSCGSAAATHAVTVKALPNAGTITGTDSVCSAATIALANPTGDPTGVWGTLSAAIATVNTTGTVTGLSTVLATTTITYTATTFSCGSATANHPVTVKPLPFAGTITGLDSVCSGATIPLADATPGGVWSSLSTAIATVTTGGVVGGASAALATTTISYTVSTFSCGSAAATHAVTVKALPNAGTITGADSVCSAATIALANTTAVPVGTWGSTGPAIATVNTAGTVTGLSTTLATTNITYTSTTFSCGSATTNHPATVKPLPFAGTITGLDSVCSGATIPLADATPGGVWSSLSTAIATVTTGGVVGGASAALTTTTISYTVSTFSCGSAAATHAVTVKALPNAGTITGADSVCSAATIALGNTTASPIGTWGSTGPVIATVNTAGTVTGLSTTLATTTITYTSTTFSCGAATANHPVTVNPLPIAGAITGADSVCSGATIVLTDPATGGIWSSLSTAVATVTSTGTVGGVATSTLTTTTISYTVSTFSCGSASATHDVTVKPLPVAGTISGSSVVCEAATTSLAETVTGGVWSSSNTARATVTAGGVVGGASAGSVTISYTVTNSCGSDYATFPMTVNPLPHAGTISGGSNVCPGNTTALSSTTPGGTWTSGNLSIATVTAGGVVGGVTAGSVTISYSYTNSCGTDVSTYGITVVPFPVAGVISGPSLVCPGATISLSSTSGGGAWLSLNTAVVTVTGGTGIVGGVAAGTTSIRYTVTNFCGSAFTTHAMTVNPIVVPSVTITLSPNDSVCAGTLVTFTPTAVNGGPTPTYVWTVFSSPVDTGATYTYAPDNFDFVACILISSAPCPVPARDTSNGISMVVFPVVTPDITVVSSAPGDVISYWGEIVSFYATVSYGGTAPTYQWYLNGAPVSGATTAFYSTTVYSEDTVYCVLTSNIECATTNIDTSNVKIITTGTLGIGQATTINDVVMYPNPNNGSFTVKGSMGASSNTEVTYQVMDMMGKVIYTDHGMPHAGSIDHEIRTGNNIAPGNYILRIVNGDESQLVHFTINN